MALFAKPANAAIIIHEIKKGMPSHSFFISWINAVTYSTVITIQASCLPFVPYAERSAYARSTAPERKHPVHTGIFFVPPFTFTLTDLILGFHILLLLLCEWLTLLPK